MAKKLILSLIFIATAFLLSKTVLATDFTSTNFKVKNPVFQIGGQKSTSTSFQLLGSMGQISIGTSTSSSFKEYSGFFYFSVEAATSTTFNFTTGGSITLTNINNTTAVFNIPSNFYSENLQLQANSYANNFFTTDKPAPSGENFTGKVYDFNFYDTGGSSVSAVSKPITISLTYTNSDVSGFNENTLTPYRWGANDSSWQLISGATVDTANKTVTFSTANFSSFALFSQVQQASQVVTVAQTGGNYSMYLESLVKLGIFPLLPTKVKPCEIEFDLNCDGSIGLKDFSIFLAVQNQSIPNPVDFNKDSKVDFKDLSILLSGWTGKLLSFTESTPGAFLIGTANVLPFRGEAAISVLKKSPEPSLAKSLSQKPVIKTLGFFKTAFKFISNLFNRVIKLFTK